MDLLNPGPQQQAQRQLLTEQQIGQMHDLAAALQEKGLDTSPIYSPWAGAARMADALAGNIVQSRQAQAQHDISDYAAQHASGAFGGEGGNPTQPMAPGWTSGSSSGPASIRNNNPGAQWPGPVSQSFGATGSQNLSDGNKIASFPDPVHGAAAHFALLAQNYAGMPLSDAIHKWSGGNSSAEYAKSVEGRTGLSGNTVITPQLLQSPQGIQLAKAMAHHEAGREFPLSDEGWASAQNLAFVGSAHAASAPNAAPPAPVLTPEALQAAGQGHAPSFEGRFGNQPQTFDQGGTPLPQGGTTGTFDQRFQPMLPQTSPPPPAPPNPGPIKAPISPQAAAPAAAPAPAQAPAQAIPHVATGPNSIPGTMTPAERAHIFALMREPATQAIGWALFNEFIKPHDVNLPTGMTGTGSRSAGIRPSAEPALPQAMPGPEGPYAPKTFLPGSRTGAVSIPGLQGPAIDIVQNGINQMLQAAQNAAPEHRKAILEWMKKQGYISE